MKNKSWKYPFSTPADKYFDGNKDGKLDGFETFFRDMYLDEINRKAEESRKTESEKKRYTVYNDKDVPITNTNDKNNVKNNVSGGVQLFVIVLVIALLIGGFILAMEVEGTMFIRALIIFAAVGICVALLKSVGLHK